MSAFSALNLSLDDQQLEAEEHTRELQVEESFKIFQNALAYLKAKQLDQASQKFDELFAMDVLKPNKWGIYEYESPTLNSLRYLAYRNRGMFYYEYLISNYEKLDSSEIVTYILRVVEDLLESIQHSEADCSVTELLVSIFKSFKSKRLQRLVLEYEITRDSNQSFLLGRRTKGLLPQLKKAVSRYESVLTTTSDIDMLRSEFYHNIIKPNSSPINTALNAPLQKINSMKSEDDINMKKLDVFELTLEEYSWKGVANALKSLMQNFKSTTLISRGFDPYIDTEEPIECIQFNIPDDIKTTQNLIEPQQVTDANIGSKTTAEINDVAKEDNIKKRDSTSLEEARPAQRSSKRFKEKDTDSKDTNVFEVHVVFLEYLREALASINCSLPYEMDALSLQNSDTSLLISDLYISLKEWNAKHADLLLQNDIKSGTELKGDAVQLSSLLTSRLSTSYVDIEGSYGNLSQDGFLEFESFISKVNRAKPHFHSVRLMLLFKLFDSVSRTVFDRDVLKYIWPSDLMSLVEWFVLSADMYLVDYMKENLDTSEYLALSTFEVLVNMLCAIGEEITAKGIQGGKTGDLKNQKQKLVKRIEIWYNILQSLKLKDAKWKIYFLWAHYHFLQQTQDISSDLLILCLEELHSLIVGIGENFEIRYPNYLHISPLNLNSLNSQRRKLNILKKIASIDSPSNTATAASDHQILLLESILIQNVKKEDGAASDCNEFYDQEMVDFISTSPLMLRLNLWEVLFSYYVTNNNDEKVVDAYFKIIQTIWDQLAGNKYENESLPNRQRMLLRIMAAIGHFTSKFSSYLEAALETPRHLSCSISSMKLLIEVIFLFYPVLYYETTSSVDSSLKSFFQRASKSASRIKDTITYLFTILLYFFNTISIVKDQIRDDLKVVRLLHNIHALLGTFKFCDKGDGKFLALSERLLCHFMDETSFAELKQILWCRYHFSGNFGDAHHIQHHNTKAIEMDRANALPLGIYLIKSQYQEKSPLLASGKSSGLKQILDTITDTLGNPLSQDSYFIAKNKSLLDAYLDSPITVTLLRQAFAGQQKATFMRPRDELQEGVDVGLFYVSAIQSLNLYKTRKKAMQARPSELDAIKVMLEADILYGTERFESWYLLAKCYSYIVEDDLTWTADKISVLDKKRLIADTQRKALLCYIMSINIFYNASKFDDERYAMLCRVLEAMGTEMVSGYYKPMDKLCFHSAKTDLNLKLTPPSTLTEQCGVECQLISDFNIEQAILYCFRLAIEISSSLKSPEAAFNAWKSYYHFSQVSFASNFSLDKITALENGIMSCQLASESSPTKDQIIEPHYALVDMCYDMVKNKNISPFKCLQYLRRDNKFFQMDDKFWELDKSLADDYQQRIYFRKLLDLLNHIVASDKKKWQHQPKFKIAKILLDEFDDIEGAFNEIDTMMSLKSTNKNLVNIWKPDLERPGTHFVYAHEYVVFYLDLLSRKGDFNSIGLAIKKIRRFGSGMAYVNDTVDYAINQYVKTVQYNLAFDEKDYSERLLPNLVHAKFLKVNEKLLTSFDIKHYSADIVESLRLAYQLKKGYNGIAFDGVCLSLYFKYFYLPTAETMHAESDDNSSNIGEVAGTSNGDQLSAPNTPSVKAPVTKKRVSKKESFDKIKLLVEKFGN